MTTQDGLKEIYSITAIKDGSPKEGIGRTIFPLTSPKNTSLPLLASGGSHESLVPPWLAVPSFQSLPSSAIGFTEQYGPLTSVLWALWSSSKLPSTLVITGSQTPWQGRLCPVSTPRQMRQKSQAGMLKACFSVRSPETGFSLSCSTLCWSRKQMQKTTCSPRSSPLKLSVWHPFLPMSDFG